MDPNNQEQVEEHLTDKVNALIEKARHSHASKKKRNPDQVYKKPLIRLRVCVKGLASMLTVRPGGVQRRLFIVQLATVWAAIC